MTPEEIIEAYNVLSQDVQNQTANEAARVGNAQRSLGPLAAAVASPSGQTSGLANYTYNRVLRPVVNTLSTSLVTTGKAAALENKLKTDLRAAKNAYEDAKNAYTVASTTPKTTTETPAYKEADDDTEYTGEKVPYTAAGEIVGVGSSGEKGFNGTIYYISYADGKGGAVTRSVEANSPEEARKKGSIVAGGYANGQYDLIFGDGSRKSYMAKNRAEALKSYLGL